MKLDGEFIRLSDVEQNQLDMVEGADMVSGSYFVLDTPAMVQNWQTDINRLYDENQTLRVKHPDILTTSRQGFLGLAVQSLRFLDFRMAYHGLRQSFNAEIDVARHQYEQNQVQINGYRQAVEKACRLRDTVANPAMVWPGSEAMMDQLIDDVTVFLGSDD